jgi:hypothetical protein
MAKRLWRLRRFVMALFLPFGAVGSVLAVIDGWI